MPEKEQDMRSSDRVVEIPNFNIHTARANLVLCKLETTIKLGEYNPRCSQPESLKTSSPLKQIKTRAKRKEKIFTVGRTHEVILVR